MQTRRPTFPSPDPTPSPTPEPTPAPTPDPVEPTPEPEPPEPFSRIPYQTLNMYFHYRYDSGIAGAEPRFELAGRLEGITTLYNTYWVRFERGRTTFANAVANSRALFEAARRAGVARIVHVSIANPSIDSPLPYYRGKALVEQALAEGHQVTAFVRDPAATRTGPDRVEPGITARHEQGLRKNNRAEVSHQPVRRRERKWMRSLVSTSRPITLACRPSIIRSTVSESVREDSSRTT